MSTSESRDASPITSAFLRELFTSLIDQDAPHRFGCCSKEVPTAIPPLSRFHIHQPQIRLVHRAVACSVCPGFSWASLAAASLRSSS